MGNSFGTLGEIRVGDSTYKLHRLDRLSAEVSHLPFSMKILLENLLRREDGVSVTAEDIEALIRWQGKERELRQIAFMPARVLMQDFTGVPAVVDLAAMRDAMQEAGKDPANINPSIPSELVIDHSVQVDAFGRPDALAINIEKEFARNKERYRFLKWGQQAFANFKVVPPDTGIVHQVNLEFLARVVFADDDGMVYPDTLVGTDSHTTMINALGVLGWGVGGIEAEAAILGQPISMLIPEVIGVRLVHQPREGTTATDIVLTIVQMLRAKGVVGKFVEFFGEGLEHLSLADRATIANMAPEYGATCGIFPIDQETLRYLQLTGRSEEQIRLVEAYAKAQGMFRDDGIEATYTDVLTVDLAEIEPCIAGPKRPQDRIPLGKAKEAVTGTLSARGCKAAEKKDELQHGSVVIAAITSCTNTSNPSLMIAAGLVAKKAVSLGLRRKAWVKSSFAPGSKVVVDFLQQADLMRHLETLGFHVVGYGCTTCIGNSGPLPEEVARAVETNHLEVCAVLSGNRNFEGRIHPLVKLNYLASPPLVIAYAIAGRMDIDLLHEPIGKSPDGRPVFLRDIWPSNAEIADTMRKAVQAQQFRKNYDDVFKGDAHWQTLDAPTGPLYRWDESSTYIRKPPFFQDMGPGSKNAIGFSKAKVLVLLGDSVTTDHISPAGAIPPDSPAGRYLLAHGVKPEDFNSYGARRGNHEVMMRGTFANIRLRNLLLPGTEGGVTLHHPSGETMSIFDAAMRYRQEGTPLIVIAGKEYGSGSSRDWAAKGPALLGVRAVIAQSFERIHRSNLVGMGILPLQFKEGDSAERLGLTGKEDYTLHAVRKGDKEAVVDADGKRFSVWIRIDTPTEWDYYLEGGILRYVLRNMMTSG